MVQPTTVRRYGGPIKIKIEEKTAFGADPPTHNPLAAGSKPAGPTLAIFGRPAFATYEKDL
jgi:hypothetical protein